MPEKLKIDPKKALHKELEANKLEEPRDRFYITHILFILLGIMHYLPYSFFITANGYWMYKFRDTALPKDDPNNRTDLQAYFASASTVVKTVTSLSFLLLSTLLGHKIKCKTRIFWTLLITSICFIAATIFVKINTDSWQKHFFILTMILLTLISAANCCLGISILAMLSRFPKNYMKSFIIGQGVAGLFSSTLQIICLAIEPSTTMSALIYFIIGATLMTSTLLLFSFCGKLKFFRYHMNYTKEDTKRPMASFSQMIDVLKYVWPCITVLLLQDLTLEPTHSAVTSLVVSEHYGDGSAWSVTYFVPVITYLCPGISSTIGRICAAKFNKEISEPALNAIMIVRMMVYIPMIWFCNAKPRHHLPIIFPHDWQYAIIMDTFFFTGAYFYNVAYLHIAKRVPKEKLELAYMVMTMIIGVVNSTLSPLGVLAVKLL